MVNNIKIIGNIISTNTVSRYEDKDTNLIEQGRISETFGDTGDYIEYYVYDIGGNLLNINYGYLNYKSPSNTGLTPGVSTFPNTTGNIQTENVGVVSTLTTPTSSLYSIIEIDPVKDLQELGYSSGEFKVQYNLFHNEISDYFNKDLFIKEISPDRTEIRTTSLVLTNEEIESVVDFLINNINDSAYFVDYLLNFGINEQHVAVNIALNKATEGYEILFKLYQPLPLTIQEKDTLWVVNEKTSPYTFDINLDTLIIQTPAQQLRGPNFNIEVPNQSTVSTQYNTYDNLVTGLQSLQQTSYHQLLNLLATQSVNINTDYTDFNYFIFFGSAYQRLSNFYTKVQQIEDYSNFISTYTPLTSSKPSLITEINQYSSSVSNIISQFDGYESYLYFESSSYTWPKSGSAKPFSLLSTGSSAVLSWYPALTSSAQDYDEINYDNLEYAVPTFIKNDENNAPFLLFLNMIGHYFDNIWIHLKAVPDINLANNNLNYGISKDLVYERLKSLGIKLYNSQAGDSVSNYLIGANTGSSTWDNNITITGSYLNNIPRKDLVSELYKRIYHNLPLLLKTKGTVAGLDHLTTIFGITGSILNVKEFGGSLKSNLINGYNNDKVRIINNDIVAGNTLSHELSLQTFPVSSSQFRDSDMNYIDISFSPQTQIDTRTSEAIASNNPSWSLDDYIGDPRQQYNTSYSDLDTQRQLYYQTGVSGYPGFTGSLMDYNGFIRLIQYFDNALFKMLNDFVPERTSLSTGVTFNSPVLERNKVSYANPTNTTTQSIYEGEISASSISSPYGTFYDALQGDKKPFFNGDLSGSIVNINQYFEDNINPYLQPTGAIDRNQFEHSDWNILLNNVSASVISTKRRKIEYTGNFLPKNSITSSVELQDSYLTLRSYNTSRYEGIQLTSLKYNTYTSASYTGSNGIIQNGDMSFGKTAVIDRNSYKVGWVKSIPSKSLNFFDKTQIQLKYLIDTQQEITDLSARNDNVIEVQNIFKSGDPVVLSLSDTNKPSRQKSLDGTKTIFRGGYSFDPILFRENGEDLNFLYTDYFTTNVIYKNFKKYSSKFIRIKSYFPNNPGFAGLWYEFDEITGITDSPFYPNTPSVVPNGPDKGLLSYYGSYDPSITESPIGGRAIASQKWNYSDWVSYIATANIDPNTNQTVLYTPYINFIIPARGIPNVYNTFSGISTNFVNKIQKVWRFDIGQLFLDSTNDFDSNTFEEDVQTGNVFFKAPADGTYTIDATFVANFRGIYEHNTNFITSLTGPDPSTYTDYQKARRRGYISGSNAKMVCIVEKRAPGTQNYSFVAGTQITSINPLSDGEFDGNTNTLHFNGLITDEVAINDITMRTVSNNSSRIPGPASFDLLEGDELRFSLYFIDLGGIFSLWHSIGDFSLGLKNRSVLLSSLITSTNLTDNKNNYNSVIISNLSDASYEFIQTTTVTGSSDTFEFYQNQDNSLIISNPHLASLFYTSSTFLPSTSSDTYEDYSPVNDVLSIQPNDLIRIGKFNAPNQRYYNVTSAYSSSVNVYNTTTYKTFTNVVFTKDDYNSLRTGTILTLRSSIKIPIFNNQNPGALSYFQNINNNGYSFKIENTPLNNPNLNKIFSVSEIFQFANSANTISDIYIFLNEPVIASYTPPTTTSTTKITTLIPTPIDTYVINVDKNIDTTGINFKRDFAILRPKPDETSVIVNHKKDEGEVSQTILIPQDASDLLKSKVGDIFNNFNTNLSNNQTVA